MVVIRRMVPLIDSGLEVKHLGQRLGVADTSDIRKSGSRRAYPQNRTI
jgi:hypothetical protein